MMNCSHQIPSTLNRHPDTDTMGRNTLPKTRIFGSRRSRDEACTWAPHADHPLCAASTCACTHSHSSLKAPASPPAPLAAAWRASSSPRRPEERVEKRTAGSHAAMRNVRSAAAVREARQLRRGGWAMRVRRRRYFAPVWNSRVLISVRVKRMGLVDSRGVFLTFRRRFSQAGPAGTAPRASAGRSSVIRRGGSEPAKHCKKSVRKNRHIAHQKPGPINEFIDGPSGHRQRRVRPYDFVMQIARISSPLSKSEMN
jgi:hypothetical protein